MRLSISNHDRDLAGLVHVYPVVSRRAQGVSIGINLNPNNACNYRCIYCQVPELTRGSAPPIDLNLLESELTAFLEVATQGAWMEECVPEGSRVIRDIAFSGNGEPTSAEPFDEIVTTVAHAADSFGLEVPLVLITNGSLASSARVQRGLEVLAANNGVAWFKLDRATDEGIREVNDWPGGVDATWKNLVATATRIPTWIQTCMFARDGVPPSEDELQAYLDLLARAQDEELPLLGVLLYGLARESHQPEASSLERLPLEWLESLAERVRALGLECQPHH
ncbi:MAG: radical SAM protein [Planctomycetes bacterium]|nr:radical SAM protein [Planctomycetota bacterium]